MTPELREHVDRSLRILTRAGFRLIGSRELPYGVQLHLSDDTGPCRLNLYHSKKKGPTVVRSGGDSRVLERAMALLSGIRLPEKPLMVGRRTGTDEAGKGDYFGPLVAAAVSCESRTAEELLKTGAGDSKKMTDTRLRQVFHAVTEMAGVIYEVEVIEPVEYNRLFAAFRSRGMNSLDIQAMVHGRVIERILKRTGDPGTVVIDRFCSMERLAPWLPEGTDRIELLTGAEDLEPAVGAASVIARSVYLDGLVRLSGKYGLELRPGAGRSVDETARQLVSMHGEKVLINTAKLHFANTSRVAGGLDQQQ